MKNIKSEAVYGVNKDYNKLDEWQQKSHQWTVTLKYDRRQMTVPFFMGQALTHEPTADDVLPALFMDAYAKDMTFEEWALEMGYDEDSRKAERTFKECKKIGDKLEKLFGKDYESIREKYENM